jgi:hypothetical protein
MKHERRKRLRFGRCGGPRFVGGGRVGSQVSVMPPLECHNLDFLRRLFWETRLARPPFRDPPGGPGPAAN